MSVCLLWHAVAVTDPPTDIERASQLGASPLHHAPATVVDEPVPPSPRRSRGASDRVVLLDERSVRNLALAMIGVTLVWRGWIAAQGYFNADDFVFAYFAAVKPLSWAYLLRGHAGHLMPGAFFVTWVLDKIAPLSFPAAVAVCLTFQAATALALLRLFRLLFGLRAAILLPLAVYLFSPITLETSMWWAAALNHLPMQLGMVLAVDSQVRYLRTGRLRWVVAAVAAFAFALLFFEKSLLIIPFLFFFTAFFFFEGGPVRCAVTALRLHFREWAVFALIGVAYYALYRWRVDFGFQYQPSASSAVDLTGTMVGTSYLPGVVGGPWRWLSIGSVGSANPPDVARWLSWEIMAGLVLVSVLIRRRAARAWILLAGYVSLDVVLLAVGRLWWIGPVIGQAYRYLADAMTPTALCLALAFIPMIGETDPFSPRLQYVIDHVPGIRVLTTAAGVVALSLFLLSAGYSTSGFTTLWANNPAKQYMANVQASLAAAPRGTVLLDAAVPDFVLNGLFFPYNTQSKVFAPFRKRPPFGPSTSVLYGFDPEGHLVPEVVGGLETGQGPFKGCGWGVTDARDAVLPLPLDLPPLVLTVKIAYLAGGDTPLTVRLGSTVVTVPLKKGLNNVYFHMVAGGSAVVLSGTRRGVGVCVDKVTVGQPVPATSSP